MIRNFPTRQAWAEAAADRLAEALAEALAADGRALFAGSGGSTPSPIYARLAQADLDWARVTATLPRRDGGSGGRPRLSGAGGRRAGAGRRPAGHGRGRAYLLDVPRQSDADHPADAGAEAGRLWRARRARRRGAAAGAADAQPAVAGRVSMRGAGADGREQARRIRAFLSKCFGRRPSDGAQSCGGRGHRPHRRTQPTDPRRLSAPHGRRDRHSAGPGQAVVRQLGPRLRRPDRGRQADGDDRRPAEPRHHHRLQRHAVGASAVRALPRADPQSRARSRRCGTGRRRGAGDVRRRHPGPRGHGAVAVLARRDRHVYGDCAVAQHVRRGAAAGYLRQDRAGPVDGGAALWPSAPAVRAGRADAQRHPQRREGPHADGGRRTAYAVDGLRPSGHRPARRPGRRRGQAGDRAGARGARPDGRRRVGKDHRQHDRRPAGHRRVDQSRHPPCGHGPVCGGADRLDRLRRAVAGDAAAGARLSERQGRREPLPGGGRHGLPDPRAARGREPASRRDDHHGSGDRGLFPGASAGGRRTGPRRRVRDPGRRAAGLQGWKAGPRRGGGAALSGAARQRDAGTAQPVAGAGRAAGQGLQGRVGDRRAHVGGFGQDSGGHSCVPGSARRRPAGAGARRRHHPAGPRGGGADHARRRRPERPSCGRPLTRPRRGLVLGLWARVVRRLPPGGVDGRARRQRLLDRQASAGRALLEPGPAVVVIELHQRRLFSPLGRADHRAGLEHEGHRVLDHVRLEVRLGRPVPAGLVRAVAAHAAVQRGAAGQEAFGLGVVLAVDQPHELAHDVAVEPRRTEGVLGYHPAGREDDEVAVGGAWRIAGRSEHGEDRRVGMIEADRADGVETAQVVFVRHVVAVPGHHVQRAVVEGGRPQLAAVFLNALRRAIHVLEPGDGRLEVARVGQAVGTDRTEVGQAEGRAVVLADVAARLSVHLDAETHAARDDEDVARRRLDEAHLGDEALRPLLRHDQQFAVGRIEDAVDHRAIGDIKVNAHPRAGIGATVAAIGGQPLDPVGRLVRHGQRVPTHPVGIGRRLSERAGAHPALRERLGGDEGFLRDLDLAELAHPLLALLLLLQQLALAGDVATVALGRHVLAQGADGLAGDDLAADGRLDRDGEHVRRDQLLHLLDHAAAARLGAGAVDQHRQGVHRLGVDQDRHLDQVADLVVGDLIVERGVALRDRLQPVVEVEHHLVQRQLIDHQGAGADVGQFDLAAATVLAQLDHPAEVFVGGQDGGLDPRLADRLDLHDVRQVGRVVQVDLGPVAQADLVDDRRRRRDQVEVELAAQALLNDLEVQQAEEAAAEAEAQGGRALHLIGEAGVVQAQLADGGAQVLEVGGVDREQAAEDHRLDFLEALQRFGRGLLLVGDGVADGGVGDFLDLGGDEADLAGAKLLDRGVLGQEDADAVDQMGRAGLHHLHPHAGLQHAVEHAHQQHHAQVGVVPGVDQHGLQRGVDVALGRRQAGDDGFQHVLDADAGLGRAFDGVRGVDADDVLDLGLDPLGLCGGQVDLVQNRHDLVVVVDGLIDVGQRLRLDALPAAPGRRQVPVPVPGAADRRIDHVGRILQTLARPGVDGGGIGAVDAVEAGVVVRTIAGIVIVDAGVAGVQAADGQAAIAQQLLVEAAGRQAQVGVAQIGLGHAGIARQLRQDGRPLLGRQVVALQQGRGVGADGPGAGLGDELLHRGGLVRHLVVVPGGGRHRGQGGDEAQLIALGVGGQAEVEDRRDQQDAVDRDVGVAAFQFIDDGGRTGGAIAFAADELGRVPALMRVQPDADELSDRLGVLGHAPVVGRIGLAQGAAEAGADRVDEDDVGDVQQRLGIVDDGEGRGAVVAGVRRHDHALGPEGAHVQPQRARAGAAVPQEGDRTVRILGAFLNVAVGDHGRERLALLVLQIGLACDGAIGDALAAEDA
uniref:Glucosamine_iso domain-containing protein n=1 Tax=Parastrongyloides trichosuri TaxID=131310 RepID=A0A0N4ZLE2_PARTI